MLVFIRLFLLVLILELEFRAFYVFCLLDKNVASRESEIIVQQWQTYVCLM